MIKTFSAFIAALLLTFGATAGAQAGVMIGATSVTASAGIPQGYEAPTSINNIIDQSGLSANYVSGVTDFDTFTSTTTATYTCCFPELGGVAKVDGDYGSITFSFSTPVTLNRIVVWNQIGSASIASFSLDGIAGVFNMSPGTSDPQVFSFASTSASSLTLRILSNEGFGAGTMLNEVAFGSDGGNAVPEPATWALMIGGFGLAGATLRRRRVANAAA